MKRCRHKNSRSALLDLVIIDSYTQTTNTTWCSTWTRKLQELIFWTSSVAGDLIHLDNEYDLVQYLDTKIWGAHFWISSFGDLVDGTTRKTWCDIRRRKFQEYGSWTALSTTPCIVGLVWPRSTSGLKSSKSAPPWSRYRRLCTSNMLPSTTQCNHTISDPIC